MGMFSSRHMPVLQVLAGAFMISFSGILVKWSDVSPTSSGFYRVFLGFVFLLMIALYTGDFEKPSRPLLLLILFCGLAFALDLYFWHISIMYIGPGLATLVGNFQVFLLAGAGIVFFGEKARAHLLLSIPLAVLGLLLIVGLDWNSLGDAYKTGIYYSLLTAFFYTIFLLVLRKIQTEGSRSRYTALMLVSLSCAAFLGVKMVVVGETFAIPHLQSLLALIGLGLFCQTIGWQLISQGMPKIQASFTGLILLLQPALAFLWDVWFFDRQTNMLNWLGVFITLVSIYMGLTGKTQQKSTAS